jgi:membrane protein DedA with SNARE-associated domain
VFDSNKWVAFDTSVGRAAARLRTVTPTDPPRRWWLKPVGRLAALLAAVVAAAIAVRAALKHVDAPSAGSLIDDYGYLGVAVGAFGDSFGLPSSGEIVVLLASAASAASASHFSLPLVIAVAWGFAVIGDACAYAIGRAAGPRVLHRFGVNEDSAVHSFMDRHGLRAVVAGRLVAGIRTKLAVVSGSTRMPFHRYVLADALGAAIWAVSVGVLGYLFAGSVDRMTARFSDAGHWLALIAFALIGVVAVWASVRYVLHHRPIAGA